MTYIGIDPGKTGGISVIETYIGLSRTNIFVEEMPLNKSKEIDIKEIYNYFNIIKNEQECFCVIEQLLPMPGQNSKATTTAGINYGKLLAALEIAGIPYQEVHPMKWKKEFQLVKKSKYQSCAVAEKLFPGQKFVTERGRIMDGAAESLLIAEYARRIK